MPKGFPIIGANRLQRVQQRHIEDLVQAEYATKGIGDRNFAAYAEEKLQFRITEGNVSRAREVFGIHSTGRLPAEGGLTARVLAVEAQIEAIERDLKALNQRVLVYITGCRQQPIPM